MEVGLIFKIAAVGILVTILGQVLKYSGREEHAFLISLAWCYPGFFPIFMVCSSPYKVSFSFRKRKV